jgi:hypothetical protein
MEFFAIPQRDQGAFVKLAARYLEEAIKETERQLPGILPKEEGPQRDFMGASVALSSLVNVLQTLHGPAHGIMLLCTILARNIAQFPSHELREGALERVVETIAVIVAETVAHEEKTQ